MLSSKTNETSLLEYRIDQLEQQLQLNKNTTLMLEEITKTGQWTWNKNLDKIDWSPEVFRCFDLELDKQPSFQEYLDMIHDDDVVEVQRTIYEDGMNNGSFKHRYKLKSNPLKMLEGFGKVYIQNENIIMYGIVRDISDYCWLNDVIETNTEFTVYRADNKTNIIDYVSGNITNMLGYSKDEVLNTNTYETIYNSNKLQQFIEEKTKKNEKDFLKVFQRIHKDKSIRTIEGTCISVQPYHVWIEKDITDIKHLENEKENTLKEYQQLIETANAPIIGVNTKLEINEWNSTIENLTGFSKPEVMGRYILDLILHEHRTDVEEILTNNISGIQTSNYQLPFMTKNDDRIELLINSTTRKDSNGTTIGAIGIGQDLTKLQETNKFKEKTLKEYQQLIEIVNAPIIGVNTKLEINEWNSTIENLTGFSKPEVMGRYILDLILHEHRNEVEDILTKTIQGTQTSNYQLPFMTKNDDRIELLINSTTRKDSNGKTIGAIGIGQDLTELKKEIVRKNNSENELNLYQKVVASVFHEVRNPLNVTHQLFEIMKNSLIELKEWDPKKDMMPNKTIKRDSPESILIKLRDIDEDLFNKIISLIQVDMNYIKTVVNDLLENINIGIQCSEQKLKVLNDILSMTQLEQGKLKLKEEHVQLEKLCKSQIDMISKTVNKGVETILKCPSNIYILGDDKHLSQIFTNILSNAVKITKEGSIILEVDILQETTTDYYLDIKIIDSGCGMDKEKVNNLLKAKRFEHGGFKHGSGIGLCIVIELLKLMDSQLEIISPYKEQYGSCFSFKVKFKKDTKISRNVSHEMIEDSLEPNNDNIDILIVDDSNLNHKVLSRQFENKLKTLFKKKPIIHSVYSGESCLDYLKTHKIDVIVMDQVMEQNKLLGTETTMKIRESCNDIIIIQSSGNCSKQDDIKYYSSGVNYVWGKPVPFKEIEIDIYRLLKDRNYYRDKFYK